MNHNTSSPTRPLLDPTRLPVPSPAVEPTVYCRGLLIAHQLVSLPERSLMFGVGLDDTAAALQLVRGESAAFQDTTSSPCEMTTTTPGSRHLRRGSWALRSPVISCLSVVAIRARDSAPRFAQANHLLLGGWGRRAGEQLLKAATSAETADSPAFSLVNRLVSAPGRIRTRDRLLRRHRQASAVVLAGRPA